MNCCFGLMIRRQFRRLKEIEAFDLEIEDGQVFIKRVIQERRSINKINDSTVTLKTLREVSRRLFHLHGQQEHQVLLKEKNHLSMMDYFLTKESKTALNTCRSLASQYSELSGQIKALSMDDHQRLREIDFLEHEIQEIEAANLNCGEDEMLELLYKKMLYRKEIAASCYAVSRLTGYEEDQAIGNQLTESIRKMQEVSHLDPTIHGFYEQLLQVEDLLGSLHQELTDYVQETEFDEQTFAETEQRLNLINGLKEKYGTSIEAILEYVNTASKRLEVLENASVQIESLKAQQKQLEDSYYLAAETLSAGRKTIGKNLQKEITKALKDLNFLSVSFEIEITKEKRISPDGTDHVRFLISTNPGLPPRPVQEVASGGELSPGLPPRPVQEVASGGELSRIMLAMKSVAAEADRVNALIFDEIDTGISGETANRVAKKMAFISKDHQVIAITHLPQIAAMADSHYFIEKQTDQKKTSTTIRQLNAKESLEEISRMISGDQRTETSMKNAKEMKSLANDVKLY